jgi:hypothetical protein
MAETPEAPNPEVPNPELENEEMQEAPAAKSNKKLFFIIGGVVLIVVIAAAAFFLFGKKGEDASLTATTPTGTTATTPVATTPGPAAASLSAGAKPAGAAPGATAPQPAAGATATPVAAANPAAQKPGNPPAAPVNPQPVQAGMPFIPVNPTPAQADAWAARQLPAVTVGATYPWGTKEPTRADPFIPIKPPGLTVRKSNGRTAEFVVLPIPVPDTSGPLSVRDDRARKVSRRAAGVLWNNEVYGLLQIGQETYIVRPGDIVEGYRVTAITRDAIVLYSPDLRREIQLPLQGPGSRVPEEYGPVVTSSDMINTAPRAIDSELAPGVPEFPND